MTVLSMTRRTLFITTASALAAPAILARTSVAQTMAEPMKTAPKTNSFKIGSFAVTVISDGFRIAEKPEETFGINQSKDDVAALLTANFLPTDKLVNGFSPVLIDTGSDLILFDTGMGEGGREWGAGQTRAGIEAAGYSADKVSVVVLTHMHGDHIGGLMEGGEPAFANARYVAGEVEYDFWKDPARVGTPAENGHNGVLKNVAPLAEKTTFIKGGAEVVPGIIAVEAFGHSPGHMVFHVQSDEKQLVLTADTANHYVLSLQRPDWEVRFDMDKAKAAAARKSIFDMIASDRLPFVGYHVPFPAVGFVEKHEQGYRFVPETYQFDI
jgi:glyoxylase-like metal-dependent hydrolase (beta-lactamase superfamily II)